MSKLEELSKLVQMSNSEARQERIRRACKEAWEKTPKVTQDAIGYRIFENIWFECWLKCMDSEGAW